MEVGRGLKQSKKDVSDREVQLTFITVSKGGCQD
jgi:hypothetical protein